jgi:putative transcriptional regulator
MSRELDALFAALLRDELEADAQAEAQQLAELGLSEAPIAPPPNLRDRLLGSTTSGRFEHQMGHIAQMLELDRDGARALVHAIDARASWAPGPVPGVALYHLEDHIPLEEVIAGFVRITPGTTFPQHSHLGDEYSLILQGRATATDQRTWVPGDLVHMPADTEHAFTVLPGEDLLFLVVIFKGIQIGETVLRPGDPDA